MNSEQQILPVYACKSCQTYWIPVLHCGTGYCLILHLVRIYYCGVFLDIIINVVFMFFLQFCSTVYHFFPRLFCCPLIVLFFKVPFFDFLFPWFHFSQCPLQQLLPQLFAISSFFGQLWESSSGTFPQIMSPTFGQSTWPQCFKGLYWDVLCACRKCNWHLETRFSQHFFHLK